MSVSAHSRNRPDPARPPDRAGRAVAALAACVTWVVTAFAFEQRHVGRASSRRPGRQPAPAPRPATSR